MNSESKTFVIAEDDSIIKMVIEDLLENMGHKVVGLASNCKQTLEMLEVTKPDIVILDIGLDGELDGIDIAKAINARFKIPFIFVTGNSDIATVEKATKTNPMGYIVKPFDEISFKQKMTQILSDQ